MSIEALLRVLPPPEFPRESGVIHAWADIEAAMGLKLPTDYKEFISRFGTGCIDRFIWIYNPFSHNPNLRLQEKLRKLQQINKELKQTFGAVLPIPLFPDPDGVLPFGGTDNGDSLSWLVKREADYWPVVVSESRGPEWECHNLNMTDFLASVLARQVICKIFPPDFPSERPSFSART